MSTAKLTAPSPSTSPRTPTTAPTVTEAVAVVAKVHAAVLALASARPHQVSTNQCLHGEVQRLSVYFNHEHANAQNYSITNKPFLQSELQVLL